jgi:hypothetical protein
MTGSHPIVTEDAASLSVIDNTFDGAWNKAKGGNGYLRDSRVCDSVYAGNTLRNLRHFTFQWPASGNVAIGNSSDADMNLHGGYERNNLFELNEVFTPYAHRPDNCWTNCGGERSSGVDDAGWYPIWWGAGKKAVKWSGSTGPNNVFFNNHMRKQLGNGTMAYGDYAIYTSPGVIYQHMPRVSIRVIKPKPLRSLRQRFIEAVAERLALLIAKSRADDLTGIRELPSHAPTPVRQGAHRCA